MTAYFSSSPTARSFKFLFLASPFSGAVFAAFRMIQPLDYWLAGNRTEASALFQAILSAAVTARQITGPFPLGDELCSSITSFRDSIVGLVRDASWNDRNPPFARL